MMTKEEAITFGEDIAARLRGEKPVADIAALAASKIADIVDQDVLAWCTALVNGKPTPSKGSGSRALWEQDNNDLLAKGEINEEEHAARRACIDTEMSMEARYRQRLSDMNVLLSKEPAFNDAMKRCEAWCVAQKAG